MSYIVMATDETGCEVRISDFDEHERGFNTAESAENAAEKAREEFQEFQEIHVEELRDLVYYYRLMNRQAFYTGYYDGSGGF